MAWSTMRPTGKRFPSEQYSTFAHKALYRNIFRNIVKYFFWLEKEILFMNSSA